MAAVSRCQGERVGGSLSPQTQAWTGCGCGCRGLWGRAEPPRTHEGVMCQDQNLPEVRLPPIQQSLWECGKEVNTCTNRNTTEGTFKTHCNARDLRRSSVRSIYLLTGLLTGPRGAQPVNYQAPLAALTGIIKSGHPSRRGTAGRTGTMRRGPGGTVKIASCGCSNGHVMASSDMV